VKIDVIHRDLKPGNVMIHNGVVKLGDFGFCVQMEKGEKAKAMVGSPVYMAPEILRGRLYDNKCDIYSLGSLIYELLFSVCPYEDNTIEGLKRQIDHGTISFPRHINNISKETEVLLRKMLVPSPSMRINWEELFNYDFSYINKVK